MNGLEGLFVLCLVIAAVSLVIWAIGLVEDRRNR